MPQVGDEMIQVAFIHDPTEAEMVRGLLEVNGIPSVLRPTGIDGPALGHGTLPRSAQRIMVNRSDADAATKILSEAMAGGGEPEPEIANAEYLDRFQGRGPRNYGLVGAYARIWLVSFGAIGLAFGLFLLFRAT